MLSYCSKRFISFAQKTNAKKESDKHLDILFKQGEP